MMEFLYFRVTSFSEKHPKQKCLTELNFYE